MGRGSALLWGWVFTLVVSFGGGCATSHDLMLTEASADASCKDMRLASYADDVYTLEGCGLSLQYRCLSDRNRPWCCYRADSPPPAECSPEFEPMPEDIAMEVHSHSRSVFLKFEHD